jgi:hypothetical protein
VEKPAAEFPQVAAKLAFGVRAYANAAATSTVHRW